MRKYRVSLLGMYKTFHDHKEAHGIDLCITKIKIESMKGAVSVENAVGVATTFKITFNSSLRD